MLRDRLVCGITNSAVQKRVLAEKELSLDKAVALAQSVEMAEQGAKDLHSSAISKPTTTPDTDLFKINPGPSTKRQEDNSAKKSKTCYRCGGKHLATQCRFKAEHCHSCGKQGHIAKVCRSRLQSKKAQTVSSKQVHNITDGPSDIEYQLFDVHTSSSNPLKTTLQVEGQELAMEIDTGAAVSLVSEETVNSSFMKDLPLVPTDVSYVVVKGGGTTLLGRDWLQKLKLDWKSILKLHSTLSLQQVLDCHESVFTDELGTFNKSKVKFYLKENAEPQFFKARQVPFSLRDKVAVELDRLQAAGIIIPSKFLQWAAPIVPIIKKDGSIRI